jgi:dodecin
MEERPWRCPFFGSVVRLPVWYARLIIAPVRREEESMSVYKVIELIGTSEKSWEDAARVTVERASETLRELRVAEVIEQDLVITNGKVEAYRTKVRLSFKYEGND